jgi:hypothetical protein
LDRIELAIAVQSFDGHDLATVGVDSQNRTRAYRFAIEQQRASTAHLDIAAELGAGQFELFAH